MSPTSTVTLRMIYFTTWEVMFTPGDSDVYMTINQLSGPLIFCLELSPVRLVSTAMIHVSRHLSAYFTAHNIMAF